jgi:hypothetical protein
MTDDEQPARVIVIKDQLYRLEPGQQGQPIEDALRGVRLPAFLRARPGGC